jgi:uncharacterized protein
VDFNTLTVVNDINSHHPLKVYNFLKEVGSAFHQYIPLVERIPGSRAKAKGFDLAPPPAHAGEDMAEVTSWSVEPLQYGKFLIAIFDEWVRKDVGNTFVQIFDNALGARYGGEASLCVLRETCGDAMVMEHDGSIFSCDHYVYPEYKLGNIMNVSLGEMARSQQQLRFGMAKQETLSPDCLKCGVRFTCNGGCPKHRFGESGLNYLCKGYKEFFNHVNPYMEKMSRLLEQGQAPALIMDIIRRNKTRVDARRVGRNDPCPCGSGLKYKRCCGKRRA